MRDLSRRLFVTAIAASTFWCVTARGQSTNTHKRVALKGYDPVAYFTDGKPVKGSDEFSYAFDDSTYWFKSADHRDKFAADPERYAPQFDGYCTVQVSRGSKLEPDPEAWTITNGKLYVFAYKEVVPIFKRETASIVEKAKENWPKLRASP